MVSIVELWLPILLGAVLVFIASAVIWMATPLHKEDIKPAPEALEGPVGQLGLAPGTYMFPMPEGGNKDFKDPAFVARFDKGPWGVLTVWKGKPNFGLNLLRTFIVYLVIMIFVAYVAGRASTPGAPYMDVFQVAGAAAVLGFTFGGLPNDIFFGKPARFVVTGLIEAAIFATLTAGVFAGFWPGATPAP